MPDTLAPVTIHAAKTHLSQLIARVEAGEEIVIARGDTPVAKLVPVDSPKPKRVFGKWADRIGPLGPDFFEPLPQEELDGFEGKYTDDHGILLPKKA